MLCYHLLKKTTKGFIDLALNCLENTSVQVPGNFSIPLEALESIELCNSHTLNISLLNSI